MRTDGADISRAIALLESEQQPDGGWGRFHSMDSKLRRRVSTTESAAWMMFELGLARGIPVVDRACGYMEALINDLSLWPEGWEANPYFPAAVPVFIVSKLAMFGSNDAGYKAHCDIWLEILEAAVSGGAFDPDAANRAAEARLGVKLATQYLRLSSVNHLLLYSRLSGMIPEAWQRVYARWLKTGGQTICYTDIDLAIPPQWNMERRPISFIRVLRLLAGFPCFAEEFAAEKEYLLSLRGGDGQWDFGKDFTLCKRAAAWRTAAARKADQTACLMYLFSV